MAIKDPQLDLASESFAGNDLDGVAGILADAEFFAFSDISGTASLSFGADLWTDGPKVVIPGQPRRIEYRGVYRSSVYPTGTRFAFFQPLEVAAPSGDIFGTAALVFGQSATLSGTGALAASAALVFDDGSSILRGNAAVSGATALTFGDAAALGGRGALAGSAAVVFGGSLAPPSTAQIEGAAAITVSVSGTLTDASTPPSGVIPGGWYGARTPEQAERERRRRRRQEEEESKPPGAPPSTEAQAGPGSADATPQAPAADLELVRSLVAFWTGEADRALLNRRAQRALDYALRAESVLAMQLFERELARQMEEEEMALLLTLLADD